MFTGYQDQTITGWRLQGSSKRAALFLQQIRNYLAITVGTILIAFAIKNIFDPVSMVTGGVSGAAIILKELWQVPLLLTNTV